MDVLSHDQSGTNGISQAGLVLKGLVHHPPLAVHSVQVLRTAWRLTGGDVDRNHRHRHLHSHPHYRLSLGPCSCQPSEVLRQSFLQFLVRHHLCPLMWVSPPGGSLHDLGQQQAVAQW